MRLKSRANRAVTVAIDGVDGVGKTTFADQLVPLLADLGVVAHRASIDDFHHQRAHRYRRGHCDPVGYFEDSFDHHASCRLVLDPLEAGGDGRIRVRHHDLVSDELLDADPVSVQRGDVVLVDGVFLQSSTLRGRWGLVVFLDAPFEVTVPRAIHRDHAEDRDERDEAFRRAAERYVPGQRLYLERCRPRERAHIVVDASRPTTARIVSRVHA